MKLHRKLHMKKLSANKYQRYCILGVAGCTILNFVLSYLTNRFGLPFYFDAIGTIFISMLAGVYWGIVTVVATNLLCCIYYQDSLYYTVIGVLIAVCASWLVNSKKNKSQINYVWLAIVLAVVSGTLGILFQWILLGEPQFDLVADVAGSFANQGSTLYNILCMLLTFGLNIVDKGVSVAVAAGVLSFVPASFKQRMWDNGWKQTPPTEEELEYINRNLDRGQSIGFRASLLTTVAVVVLTAFLGGINIQLAVDSAKGDGRKEAAQVAKYAATLINGDFVEQYLSDGEVIRDYTNESYVETYTRLKSILDIFSDLQYLYVYQIREDGCYTVFDTDPEVQGDPVGECVAFDEDFLAYVPALLAGETIDPIELSSRYGYFITAYEPVYDSKGSCVAYVGADFLVSSISGRVRQQIANVLLLVSGLLALILATAFFVSRYHLTYPMGSLTSSIGEIMQGIEEQDRLDESVKKLQKLDIRTSNELEKLYHSICEMAAGTAEQMRRIRVLADRTEKMQMGLIITMADMVENRDSDTGAHIQKTAAYVRIILNGLKRRGYYAEKLTDKYMRDVEMSAPLHDVGKINVPDAVLNKPGKLTEEEIAIMKTHTTAGKQILEHAISTVSGGDYLKEAKNMAAYHHERWDGKGYPEGLHGQVIPLSARVMAVADVFDALVSPRIYKAAFPLEKALEILQEGAGTQFDPKCVEVFMDSLDEVKRVMKKYQE